MTTSRKPPCDACPCPAWGLECQGASGSQPTPHVQVTRYEVSLLPADDINRHHFTVYVEWRGNDLWAVCDGFHQCLGADGEWSYESIPSERRDDWITAHRFSLDTALRLAKQAAPAVTVNGVTATEALRRRNAGPGTVA